MSFAESHRSLSIARLGPTASHRQAPMHIYVRLVISYDVPAFPGVPFGAMFEFVDTAPHFPSSARITAAYEGLRNVDVQVIHSDIPHARYKQGTHMPVKLSLH